MCAAEFQRLGALTLILASAGFCVPRSALAVEPYRVADVNVRYHLLPGVRLNARPLSPAGREQKSTTQEATSSRPNVPPPVENRKTEKSISLDLTNASKGHATPTASVSLSAGQNKTASWEPLCPEPVRVSFFGDFWVPPYSPAADLKKNLFDNLRPLLNWSDFNVANFEGNITQATKRAFPKFPFALKQAPESPEWLKSAGVKYFTRANNHSMDFGWTGAQETTAALNKAGAKYAGIGENLRSALSPMWLEKNGMKIAVFSLTTTYPAEAWAGEKRAGVAFPAPQTMRAVIEKTRAEADFIVVVFHWGDELKPNIKSHQEEYGKMALQAGADFVVGHHAHLAQKIDSESNDGMIVYGVGNFVFASLSRDAKFALGAHAEFCRNEVADVNGDTHHYRLVFSPLTTNNRMTGYKSRPMTLPEFAPFAREYVKKGYFSPNLEFYIPSEDSVKSLSDWLQPRSQASKEGRTVN